LKAFIDQKFIPKDSYEDLTSTFSHINFVHDIEKHKDIDLFFGLNKTLLSIDLSEYKDLKWIQLYMAGFDNVDVEALKSKGIRVSNAQDIFSITIAEDVLSKILFFNRNTKEFIEQMETKTWQQIWKDKEIWHSTIGILGTGSIGRETAKRLQSFEPKKIMGYRRNDEPVPYFDEILTGEEGLKKLMQASDYLIIAIPLNDDTHHLIDKEKLMLMKKDALLINVARGSVIVQDDLIEILENKLIRGAGLDVTDPEPLPKSSRLWTLDNCFITPHNASSSEYMVERLYDLTVTNLKRYINHKDIMYEL